MRSKTIASMTMAGVLAATCLAQAAGVSARQLAAELKEGAQVTLIDARSEREFAEGHIPGALHVPARALAHRRLPPLGDVVVYGDGLGRFAADEAVALLEGQPGIRARALNGGMAAWQSAGLPTTHAAGLTMESIAHITYDQLDKVQRDVILVDLRRGNPDQTLPASASGSSGGPAAGTLTDLGRTFPGARVMEAAKDKEGGEVPGAGTARRAQRERAAAAAARSVRGFDPEGGLLVLIDDGDGSAEEAAQLIRASGNRRVVILAGGENILRHEGRSGLGRWGAALSSEGDDGEDAASTGYPESQQTLSDPNGAR